MGFDCPCEELDSPVECEPKGRWIGSLSGAMPRVKENGAEPHVKMSSLEGWEVVP